MHNFSEPSRKAIGIILTYNCANTLEDIYRRIPKEALHELIVVDDGSTDSTIQVAQRLGIKYFTHEHTGYGGNMKYGLRRALEMGGEYMVEIHGDGQYDPSVIPQTVEKMREGSDLLIGSRFTNLQQPLKDRMPFIRYLVNIISSFIYRAILGVPLTEFHSGFHVYGSNLLAVVDLETMSDGHLFSFEIIVRAHYCKLPIAELPIRCNYAGTHSSISVLKSIIFMFQTLGVLSHYLLARLGIKTGFFCRR